MSRKPDFRVGALNKETDEKNSNIGVAWKNEDGTISLVFDGFITLPISKALLITLFPIKEKAPS